MRNSFLSGAQRGKPSEEPASPGGAQVAYLEQERLAAARATRAAAHAGVGKERPNGAIESVQQTLKVCQEKKGV